MEMCAVEGDTVDINCPFYKEGTSEKRTEQSIIYRVSKEEYDECRVDLVSREVGRCNRPLLKSNLKIAFRPFHPNPFALEYKADNTYYFISTSTGRPSGLENRLGGMCTTHALKMKIHVIGRGGNCQHHHRHHHTHRPHPSSVTAAVPFSPTMLAPRIIPDLPENEHQPQPLWEHFYEKILAPSESSWSSSFTERPSRRHSNTRGERVALDAEPSTYKMADTYEALSLQLDNQVEFQIHEIGEEPDSLPYSSSTTPSIGFSRLLMIIFLIVMPRLR